MDADITLIWSPGRHDPRRFAMGPPRGHHLFWAETLILTRPPGGLRQACSKILGRVGSGRVPRRASDTYPVHRRRAATGAREAWPRGLVLASACMLGWSVPVLAWLALT